MRVGAYTVRLRQDEGERCSDPALRRNGAADFMPLCQPMSIQFRPPRRASSKQDGRSLRARRPPKFPAAMPPGFHFFRQASAPAVRVVPAARSCRPREYRTHVPLRQPHISACRTPPCSSSGWRTVRNQRGRDTRFLRRRQARFRTSWTSATYVRVERCSHGLA